MTQTRQSRRLPVWLWLTPLLIIALAVVFLAFRSGGSAAPEAESGLSSASEQGPASPQGVGPVLQPRGSSEPRRIGADDAPVTLVVISDYQCQYCALWTGTIQPQLKAKYVDSGRLRIEYRDISIFGEASARAARAAYAAAKQGKFSAFHDELFAEGSKPSAAELSEEALLTTAARIGADRERFREDFLSPLTAARIDQDTRESQSQGVNSTPTFIINGKGIVGAQPLQVFEQLIEQALSRQG